jgi:hypothetical protein
VVLYDTGVLNLISVEPPDEGKLPVFCHTVRMKPVAPRGKDTSWQTQEKGAWATEPRRATLPHLNQAVPVDDVDAIAWSPDGRTLALHVCASRSKENSSAAAARILLWDAAGDARIKALPCPTSDNTTALRWTPNAARIVAVGIDTLEMYDISTGTLCGAGIATNLDFEGEYDTMPIPRRHTTSGGNTAQVMPGSHMSDGPLFVGVWAVPPQGEPQRRLRTPAFPFSDDFLMSARTAWSADGKRIACCYRTTHDSPMAQMHHYVIWWDAATGSQLAWADLNVLFPSLHLHSMYGVWIDDVRWSPQLDRLAIYGNGYLYVLPMPVSSAASTSL